MIYQREERRSRKGCGTVIVLFLLVVVGIIAFTKVRSRTTVSPLPVDQKQEPFFSFLLPKKDPDALKAKLQKLADEDFKNYSIMVVDFTSDFSVEINGHVTFTGASINKLPILAALYYQAQKGVIDLDKVVSLQAEDIQDYGTGSIRYDPVGTTYSVKTLARLMMQKSDNTAAYILARQIIGMNTIQELIASWGMTQTDMEGNKISNADVALLMEKIYMEKIANHALTLEMLSFLKDGDFEDRLPAYLPKDVAVYHKTGNGVGYIHDVGIVVGPKARYYIGIFTSDISDEAKAMEHMARLSEQVYAFMK